MTLCAITTIKIYQFFQYKKKKKDLNLVWLCKKCLQQLLAICTSIYCTAGNRVCLHVGMNINFGFETTAHAESKSMNLMPLFVTGAQVIPQRKWGVVYLMALLIN